jgi:hypothetical protein
MLCDLYLACRFFRHPQFFLAALSRDPQSPTMNREAESELISFCVEQHAQFDASAWPRLSVITPLELAAAARFLAGVTWYGHQEQLRQIADRLSLKTFSELAHEVNFDPSRFAGLLKAHLQHASQSVAR